MNNKLAPVVLFVYNRLEHTKKTVEALSKNIMADDSDLFIYSDAPANITKVNSVFEVRDYLKTITGFKSVTIIERDYNYGIELSVATSVPEIALKYGKVIVVEDDIVTSKYFLKFMNSALDCYEKNKNISMISGFNYPSSLLPIADGYKDDVYLFPRNCSYGWGTWSYVINEVKWDYSTKKEIISNNFIYKKLKNCGSDVIDMIDNQLNKNNSLSWDVCVTIYQCLNDLYTLYPVHSFVNNIGFDNSGLHCPATDIYYNDLEKSIPDFKLKKKLAIDNYISKGYKIIHKKSLKSNIRHFFNKFLSQFGYRIENTFG